MGNAVLGQTIHMDCNGFNRLAIKLGVFDKSHDQPVIFALATNTGGQEIVSQKLTAASHDHQWRAFTFGPLPKLRDRSLFLYHLPTSTLENSLTDPGLYRYPGRPVPGRPGLCRRSGRCAEPIQADFAFLATCDQSLRGRLAAGVEKIAAAQLWGPAYKGFYWAILGLHSLLLCSGCGWP